MRREAEDLRRRLAELNRQQQASRRFARRHAVAARAGRRASAKQRQRQAALASAGVSEQSVEGHAGSRTATRASSSRRGSQDNRRQSQQSAQSAQEASRNLRHALQQIDQPEPSRLDEDAGAIRRSQRADARRTAPHRKRSVRSALATAERSARAGRGGIDQRRAQELVRVEAADGRRPHGARNAICATPCTSIARAIPKTTRS